MTFSLLIKEACICALLATILFSCHAPEQKENNAEAPIIKENTRNDSLADKSLRDLSIDHERSDSILYIDLLEKFYFSEEYYVPLYFINAYSESAVKEMNSKDLEIIFEDIDSKRVKLDEKIAAKYLLLNNLDQLIVLDESQNIIDTLVRKNYEYFDSSIESFYIATYDAALAGDSNIVMSLNGTQNIEFRKSPEFKEDSVYIRQIITKNAYKPDYLYDYGHLIHHKDTIAFLSFGDYKQGKECLYLLMNGQAVDSVINNYVISKMTPVPLATEKEILYVSSVHVPETDIYWASLTGIDLVQQKFKFYRRNRLKIGK